MDISPKEAKKLTTTFINELAENLDDGNSLTIQGFGSFEVKERAARTGRNPKTGEAVEIPASKYVAFSAGSSLKDKVNG